MFRHEAGKHFILKFGIYCSFHHDEAGIFKCFFFILKQWIRWGRYQLRFLNLTPASSNHAGGATFKFIWQFTALSFHILLNLYWKMWKTLVKACKLLKSFSKKPWGRSKEIKLIYYLSLPDEGGEIKTPGLQFFGLFLKILTEAGRYIILWIS